MFGVWKIDSLINYKNNKKKHENEEIVIRSKIEESKKEKSIMTDRHHESTINKDEISTEPSKYKSSTEHPPDQNNRQRKL